MLCNNQSLDGRAVGLESAAGGPGAARARANREGTTAGLVAGRHRGGRGV